MPGRTLPAAHSTSGTCSSAGVHPAWYWERRRELKRPGPNAWSWVYNTNNLIIYFLMSLHTVRSEVKVHRKAFPSPMLPAPHSVKLQHDIYSHSWRNLSNHCSILPNPSEARTVEQRQKPGSWTRNWNPLTHLTQSHRCHVHAGHPQRLLAAFEKDKTEKIKLTTGKFEI